MVRSGILKHDLPVAITLNPLVINQDIKAFQPRSEFTSQYLAWAISSKEDELLSMTKAMTVDSIDSKVLYSIPVMVAPMELQLQFDAFVQQLDKSKFSVSNRNLSSCLREKGFPRKKAVPCSNFQAEIFTRRKKIDGRDSCVRRQWDCMVYG